MISENENLSHHSSEITLRELVDKIIGWVNYLKTKWFKVLLVGFFGGTIGFLYAWLQPITYSAKLIFVVEEGKAGSNGFGGLGSLAGQFGVDVGGASGGGVLSGDNILLYFKSESLAREVLLSKFDSTSNLTLADIYANVYKLKDKWASNPRIGNITFFLDHNNKFTRIQDSLVYSIIQEILGNKFNVVKTDKKAGFIEVKTTMLNESLAKIYCEKVVKVAVDRYINIKTQRQKETVLKLQARVDSIAFLLNRKTVSSASIQTSTSTMDINPLYKTGSSVAFETNLRDKTML